HDVPGAGAYAAVGRGVGIIVVVAHLEGEVNDLMGDGAGTLALAHTGESPLHLAGLPTGPGRVAGDDPSGFGGVRVAPLGWNVFAGLELHLTELLPDAGFVIARVDADDDIVFGFDVARACAPQGIGIRFKTAVGGEAIGNAVFLAPLVEAV